MSRPFPILAVAVLLAAIAFAASPLLSSGFAGYRPEQFPIQQDFWPVQPAGWAFSIWGVIYLWLIAGAIWGLFKTPDDTDWQAMRKPLLISLAIGAFWVAAANASPVLATFMIVAMAVAAIMAMLRAGHGTPVWQVRPVALYAGWLTAATGVGTGVVLGGYGLVSPNTAALTMLGIVLIVALYVQSCRSREWAYPLAIIWALAGVIAANLPTQNWSVIALAALGILALAYRLLRAIR
ncbi:hypothetical protein PEL8287_01256 [Roseovarius litorisediminis]|uniref:TspO/MBR family protein n=1 Tax=Roseovarius litorisediminis TaxID=1312363 RepID=A0A1Y5RXJ4_9RHOB|nr:hypothetical protein [Roseovarius litorisediminis]SLN27833.1 hypothetical protein PEL8287_01256 [Roseovarius litorisediminis]